MTSLFSRASRARIQLRLPITVLISPLWAIIRYGWESSRWERFRGEAGMHHHHCARHPLVQQLREDLGQLWVVNMPL